MALLEVVHEGEDVEAHIFNELREGDKES